MLKRPGQINAILALECGCSPGRIAEVRSEIGKLLPETEVIEFASSALTRAEARNRAAQLTEDEVDQVRQERDHQLHRDEAFAALIVPGAIAVSGGIIALLMYLNVRQRRSEIGIFRALGFRGRAKYLALFLLKALLMALVGAAVGLALGTLVAAALDAMPLASLLSASSWRWLLAVPAAPCYWRWQPAGCRRPGGPGRPGDDPAGIVTRQAGTWVGRSATPSYRGTEWHAVLLTSFARQNREAPCSNS